MLNNVNSIGFIISNKCQLNCKYCYIKNNSCNSFLNKDYEDNFNSFLNNKEKFINKIHEKFENISRYEFWGAEPLLYYNELYEFQKYIIEIMYGGYSRNSILKRRCRGLLSVSFR